MNFISLAIRLHTYIHTYIHTTVVCCYCSPVPSRPVCLLVCYSYISVPHSSIFRLRCLLPADSPFSTRRMLHAHLAVIRYLNNSKNSCAQCGKTRLLCSPKNNTRELFPPGYVDVVFVDSFECCCVSVFLFRQPFCSFIQASEQSKARDDEKSSQKSSQK